MSPTCGAAICVSFLHAVAPDINNMMTQTHRMAQRTPHASLCSPMAKLKLDLHDIYNRGKEIDSELNRIIDEAVQRRITLVEIIPGKGSGQLKKKVVRFLDQKHIKAKYHRVEKDSDNFGRLFVHFRF
jgi:DNA-nicking Smr family endonuclease